MNTVSPELRAIFWEALDLPSEAERQSYLERACGTDDELRSKVEALLHAHRDAGSFLEESVHTPPVALGGPAPPEAPGMSIGPYKLLEPIGEGGMGVVYMAEQILPVRRKVALKIIKPGMDTKQVVARFEAERQALALMDHPNIARVLDAGATESGRPYFVMELVRGVPITEYCDHTRLSIEKRLELFVLVCRAVQHAHQKGIIHRDIKPSNVLITLHDGVPVPKVIDFGIAKATGQSLTEKTLYTGFAQLVGTPLYMSPEQAELSGLDVDTRSDIYSLGVLLYELLTGTTPFEGEVFREAAFDEIRRIIREQEPQKPSTRLSALSETITAVSSRRGTDARRLNRVVRGELDWIVMKALEKDRRRRYEAANDFASDVMRYLTDQPVEASPPSAWYRFGKFARRNRAVLATTTLVAASLVAGTVVSTWQAVVAVRARRAEAKALATARRAVDEMYTEVAEQWIAQQPGLSALQQKFLEKALVFFEQFAEARSDDPEAMFQAANARMNVARIRRKLGQFDRSDAAYRQAIEQLEHLVARFPDRTDYQGTLANLLCADAGQRFQLGRTHDAETIIRRAVTIAEGLVAREPGHPRHRDVLANSLLGLGDVLALTGRRREAEAPLVRSRTLLEQLADKAMSPRKRLASCENDLGNLYGRLGRRQEAERAFQAAVKRLESFLADAPSDPEARSTLALVFNNLANVQQKAGRTDEALENNRRAEGLLATLVREFPRVIAYRGYWIMCLGNLAMRLQADGRAEDVERIARGVTELSERADALLEVPEYRQKLAQLLAIFADFYSLSPEEPHHDPSRALELTRRAVELDPKPEGIVSQSREWALYRVGDWKGCIESAQKRGKSSFAAAMAYWQLGEREKAIDTFNREAKWLADREEKWSLSAYPSLATYRRMRSEAAALLGLDQ